MLQFIVIVLFFMVAVAAFAGALQFSKYKNREDGVGCCGGGHCSADGNHSHSCYSSKSDFVDNFDKIKTEKIKM
jgi:hypothetical protein